jgi:hypothetical protein
MQGGSSNETELCALDWVSNVDRPDPTSAGSPEGGVPTGSGQVPLPLQRKQIKAPMHAVLLAGKALLRRFGLSALVIARDAQSDPQMPAPG